MSIVSDEPPEGPPRSSVLLVAAALVLLGLLLAGLVALQRTVGGVPLLGALVPASAADLTVVDGAPPPLDCGYAIGTGGLMARDPSDPGRRDLGAAAQEQRLASSDAAVLVGATGYRTGDGSVTVVWHDAQVRARLILSYVRAKDGYVLAARSGCTAG